MMSNNRAEVKKVRDKYHSKKYIFFRLIFDDIRQLEFHTISRHHLHGVYGLNPAHVGIDGWMNGLPFFYCVWYILYAISSTQHGGALQWHAAPELFVASILMQTANTILFLVWLTTWQKGDCLLCAWTDSVSFKGVIIITDRLER